jgi:RNA binding exosome subunit
MSTKSPIAYINIRVFAHATEDPIKVQTAVQNLLPMPLVETIVFEKTNCTGHHGNPIILFTAKLVDKNLLSTALEKFGKEISALDKEVLNRDLKLHLEKGNLYLRFDKQSAYLGALKFSQNEPIHIKMHFKNKTAQEIMEILKQAGLLP